MNFNTLLLRFGLNPDDFVNSENDPIITDNGYIYEVNQRTDVRICSKCGSNNCYINNYYYTETSLRQNKHINDVLRVRKVRFKCKDCGKSFTPAINGVERRNHISQQVEELIYHDFFRPLSFSTIATNYGLTRNRVIQIFDRTFKTVPRRPMPRVLCIDEKRFSEEINQKFCCVLYDYESKEIVDLIKNRQLPYLEEYFENIPESERNNVKYFVSDMYDGYATIARKFFPKATHIVDLFHIVRLITQSVNSIRTLAMKKLDKDTDCYRFMKRYWKLFLIRSESIPDKYFKCGHKNEIHFDEMVSNCIKTDKDLLATYNILQDFYHYYLKRNYKEAYEFVDYISKRLEDTNCEIAITAASSFKKWKSGIATSIAKSQNKIHYSNSVAENTNNHIETILRISYGYHNFDRFRKRVLLILTYGNKK